VIPRALRSDSTPFDLSKQGRASSLSALSLRSGPRSLTSFCSPIGLAEAPVCNVSLRRCGAPAISRDVVASHRQRANRNIARASHASEIRPEYVLSDYVLLQQSHAQARTCFCKDMLAMAATCRRLLRCKSASVISFPRLHSDAVFTDAQRRHKRGASLQKNDYLQ
jgi:hypothetical protein